ncbi:class I SAM-dependent methyltransferase [Kitasatospora acidiphila]|uniref:Class I SAM-dependent methyltransferase n=1 Tax=Kitasatospora acidiphila TaxID=2567942 RepID=A0A540WG53_9ACTN|nr:class I SAM-dependent methyltransferase [Kitasatospora acidiphila]TQF08005.1 class I SAM-dependent methyltransferase [Kitasatospora acidiphila]
MPLFPGAARAYREFRPSLPEGAVALLTDTVRGIPRPVLLDLGTGTGQVPAALHQAFARVDVVERDPEMIAEAEKALQPLMRDKPLGVHACPAEEFSAPYPGYQAHLVTCCRAFHWMPQDQVLSVIDEITAPGAVVAVMGDGSLWTARNSWTDPLRALIQTYLGPERRAGTEGTYTQPHRRYEEVLADSPFSRIEEHVLPVVRRWTPDQVVGYLASTSFAADQLFGDQLAAFQAQALELLERHAVNGDLTENAEFTILLASRP